MLENQGKTRENTSLVLVGCYINVAPSKRRQFLFTIFRKNPSLVQRAELDAVEEEPGEDLMDRWGRQMSSALMNLKAELLFQQCQSQADRNLM